MPASTPATFPVRGDGAGEGAITQTFSFHVSPADFQPLPVAPPKAWQRIAVTPARTGLRLKKIWKRTAGVQQPKDEAYKAAAAELSSNGLVVRKRFRPHGHVPVWGMASWDMSITEHVDGTADLVEARVSVASATRAIQSNIIVYRSKETTFSEDNLRFVPRKRSSNRRPKSFSPSTAPAADAERETQHEEADARQLDEQSMRTRRTRRMSRRITLTPILEVPKEDFSGIWPAAASSPIKRTSPSDSSPIRLLPTSPTMQFTVSATPKKVVFDDLSSLSPADEDLPSSSPVATPRTVKSAATFVFDQPAEDGAAEPVYETRRRLSLHDSRRRKSTIRSRSPPTFQTNAIKRRHSFFPDSSVSTTIENRRHTFGVFTSQTTVSPSRKHPTVQVTPVEASTGPTVRQPLAATLSECGHIMLPVVDVDVRTNLDIFGLDNVYWTPELLPSRQAMSLSEACADSPAQAGPASSPASNPRLVSEARASPRNALGIFSMKMQQQSNITSMPDQHVSRTPTSTSKMQLGLRHSPSAFLVGRSPTLKTSSPGAGSPIQAAFFPNTISPRQPTESDTAIETDLPIDVDVVSGNDMDVEDDMNNEASMSVAAGMAGETNMATENDMAVEDDTANEAHMSVAADVVIKTSVAARTDMAIEHVLEHQSGTPSPTKPSPIPALGVVAVEGTIPSSSSQIADGVYEKASPEADNGAAEEHKLVESNIKLSTVDTTPAKHTGLVPNDANAVLSTPQSIGFTPINARTSLSPPIPSNSNSKTTSTPTCVLQDEMPQPIEADSLTPLATSDVIAAEPGEDMVVCDDGDVPARPSLGDDSETEMLRKFVTRVRADKSAKEAAARITLKPRPKRRSGSTGSSISASGSPVSRKEKPATSTIVDEIAPAATTRKALAAMDTNMSPSPTKKRKFKTQDSAAGVNSLLAKPALDDHSPPQPKRRRKKMEADTGGIYNPDFEPQKQGEQTLPPRRSGRSRSAKVPLKTAATSANSALSLIPVRLPGSLNLGPAQSDEAAFGPVSTARNNRLDDKDLAATTRSNTRKNKAGALPVDAVLARQADEAGFWLKETKGSNVKGGKLGASPMQHIQGKPRSSKEVRWASVLARYQGDDEENLPTGAEATGKSVNHPGELGGTGVTVPEPATPLPTASDVSTSKPAKAHAPTKSTTVPARRTRASKLQPPTPRKEIATKAQPAARPSVHPIKTRSSAAPSAPAAAPMTLAKAQPTKVTKMGAKRAGSGIIGMGVNGTPAPKRRTRTLV